MRRLLVPPLLLTIALAGCLGGSEKSAPGPVEEKLPPAAANQTKLPANISKTEEVLGAVELGLLADFLPVAGPVPLPDYCASPTSGCQEYKFKLEAAANGTAANSTAGNATGGFNNVTITASLTYTLPASGFGLYLLHGDDIIDSSEEFPPAKEQSLQSVLTSPGEYSLLVVPYVVAKDTITVTATFAQGGEGTGIAGKPDE